MLKKGIIMSLSPSYAVILEKGGAFHHIQLKENMTIGQAILFTNEDILSQAPSLVHHLRPLMALAAAVILFLIPTLYAIQTPYAVISLDINPSIELLLGKQGTVKKVIAKNEDGVTLNLAQLKGHTLEDALHDLSVELTLQDFIGTSPSILVSYADLKTNSLDLSTSLHTYMETNFKDAHIVYLPSDKQTYSLSNKAHLSLGRYNASHLLSEQLPDVDFETIDISSLINYLEPDDDLDDTEEDSDELNNLSEIEDTEEDWNDSDELDDDLKELDELPLSKPVSSSNITTQKPNGSNNSSTNPPSDTVQDSNDKSDDSDSNSDDNDNNDSDDHSDDDDNKDSDDHSDDDDNKDSDDHSDDDDNKDSDDHSDDDDNNDSDDHSDDDDNDDSDDHSDDDDNDD